MTPLPLSATQQAALDVLLAAGRLTRVSPDVAKAKRFLASATVGLADIAAAETRLGARSRHRLAYDAAHDAVEALLAAYGYRTASGPGAHQALAAAVEAILDTPPDVAAAAASYDPLRQKRNGDHDKAEVITTAEADRAVRISELIHAAAHARLS